MGASVRGPAKGGGRPGGIDTLPIGRHFRWCDEAIPQWTREGCDLSTGQAHPCDIGSCYGDDTHGDASATGTCYRDGEVPDFGCVADCDALLGSGAFCMTDHPDHARCVPVGTTLPKASNCWWDGGHMDPQELECTSAEECASHQGCYDLGYPTYFACESSRCVPAL